MQLPILYYSRRDLSHKSIGVDECTVTLMIWAKLKRPKVKRRMVDKYLENQTLIKVCKLERNNQKVKFIRSQLRALL